MKRYLALAVLILAVTFTAAFPAALQIDMLLSQVRTNAGGSLAGGHVHFYSTGTTTNKTVWTDYAKTTAAANPYTLDSNGTALLYGDGLYRIVIHTSAGVTAFDWDNIRYEDIAGAVTRITSLAGDGTGSITGFNIPLYLTNSLSVYDALTAWVDVRYASVLPASSAATNTAGIQAAVDLAYANGGGDVHIFIPGTYLLARQGVDPNWSGYYSCINMKTNVKLVLHPGVVLKLADGQHANATKVNIISIGNVNNVYIGGGGRITGNTAGQTGWTGGYGQSCAGGCIISGRFTATPRSGKIIIEDLTLDDYFSNPVNIGGGAGRPYGVELRNLWTDNVGEGFQVVAADNVIFENLHVTDTSNNMTGDALEMAGVNYFSATNLFVSGKVSSGGSAFDGYLSSHGSISHLSVSDWPAGIAFASTTGNPSKNITVSDVTMRNIGSTGPGLGIAGPETSNINVTNFIADNCANYGAQLGNGNATGPVGISISNSSFVNNNGGGILFTSVKNLSLSNVTTTGNTGHGIAGLPPTAGIDNSDLTGLSISNITTNNNSSHGILISNQGYGNRYTGHISGVIATGNAGLPVSVGDVGQQKYMIVEGLVPDEITAGDGATVTGYRHFRPTVGFQFLPGGTKGQRITVSCDNSITIIDNTAITGGLHLSGAANFSCTAWDRLELLWDYVTDRWFEISRSVN